MVILLNIIICEDKAEYIKEITRIVKDFFAEEDIEGNIKSFNKYEETINYIKNLGSYEDCLYILDIGLKEDKNGLMLGREIREIDDYKGEMIYITAYIHQVSNVFKYKLRILDFIDKGFKLEEDLKEALKVYLKIYKEKIQTGSLVFKEGTDVFLVKPQDIVWIETDKQTKKLIIHTVKEEISTRQTLKEVQEKLTSDFIQVHRSSIVNKNHVKKLEEIGNDLYVVLTGDIKKSISKRKEKEIRKCIT